MSVKVIYFVHGTTTDNQEHKATGWIPGELSEKGLHPITKANKIEHIDLNLDALNFKMDREDYEKLNEFRCKAFDDLEVDWLDQGGIPIYKFANQVE